MGVNGATLSVSETVTVQTVGTPTWPGDGEQETVVEVECWRTVKVAVPLLAAFDESPP